MKTDLTDGKLHAALLLARRVEGDRLMLADEVINAALDGRRHLAEGERAAMEASPLTMRRFRVLADMRRALLRRDGAWSASHGMLRAASGGQPLSVLATDDGYWGLHFIENPDGWSMVLVLDGTAPFAVRLLREQPMLRVIDGGGAILLQGSLDADGECEAVWPFETAPEPHLHEFGAGFSVEPVH